MEMYLNIKAFLCKDYKNASFVALELPKELDLLLDLPSVLHCDKWGMIKLNHYVVNNMQPHRLQ